MDKVTFTQEVKMRERQLYRIARSYSLSDADCCDAVQEALMRAWAKKDTLRDEAAFGTWLIRILMNECKTTLRKRSKIIYVAEFPDIAIQVEEAPDPMLEKALLQLPTKYRIPLMLNALDGYTLCEIGHILRIPEGTAKSRVSRAKQRLRKIITQEVHDDEKY